MKEFLLQFTEAIYDEKTGMTVFKPKYEREIVRCKDCKRFEQIENGTGACVDGYGSVMGIHADNWFCADGERKC